MIKISHSPKPNNLFEQLDELRSNTATFPTSQRIISSLRQHQKKVVNTLKKGFHDKCAYCERPLYDEGLVDHFRPKSKFPKNAEVWENLFLACKDCSFSKGGRFPIIEVGKRKLPALINPSEDEPSEHIVFTPEGFAIGITERGKITVEVLRLNRQALLEERRHFLKILRFSRSKNGKDATKMLQDDAPFAGFLRQAVHGENRDRNLLSKQESFVAKADKKYTRSLTTQKRGESLSIRYIESITLRNVGGIERLDLSLRSGEANNASWLMILGDNGVGKSTVLKAIAFALAGDKLRGDLAPLAIGLLPNSGTAEIVIQLSGVGKVIVRIDNEKHILLRNYALPQTPILGYGATRLLPTVLHGPKEEKPYARLRNLFDPFTPLINAGKWLGKLSDEHFSDVSKAIVSLLGLPASSRLIREELKIFLKFGRRPIPLEGLSDGYQSVIGLAADIMSVLLKGGQQPASAEAIVLLDELGAHLHPSWRLQIVNSLRRTFPRVQFVVTTHEPLCLRGMVDGEISVLRRTKEGKLVANSEILPVDRLSVDQLLSSELFGLSSTRSAEVNFQFARYYELLALGQRTVKQEVELKDLERRLQSEFLLGATPREREALLAIDKKTSRKVKKITNIGAVAVPSDLDSSFKSIFTFAGIGKKELGK